MSKGLAGVLALGGGCMQLAGLALKGNAMKTHNPLAARDLGDAIIDYGNAHERESGENGNNNRNSGNNGRSDMEIEQKYEFYMFTPTLIDKATGEVVDYSKREGNPAEFKEDESIFAKGIIPCQNRFIKFVLYNSAGDRVSETESSTKYSSNEFQFKFNLETLKFEEVYTAAWYDHKYPTKLIFKDGTEEILSKEEETLLGKSSFKRSRKNKEESRAENK